MVLVIVALVRIVHVLASMVLVVITLMHIMHVPFLIAVVLVIVALVRVVHVLAGVMLVFVALMDLMCVCGHTLLLVSVPLASKVRSARRRQIYETYSLANLIQCYMFIPEMP